MARPAVYNEIDPYCCEILRARIEDGWLPPGDVDERDIREVSGDDYKGYGQIHLFAGIGGFGYAARLAGLPDDYSVLTGGFPCQDISVAGRGEGIEGERSGLWSEQARLIGEIRPRRALVENVAALLSRGMGRVLGDLSEIGYDAEWEVIPASAIGAFHCRQRVWILAYPNNVGVRLKRIRAEASRAWGEQQFQRLVQDQLRSCVPTGNLGGISDGVSHRMGKLKSLGNAIVPQVAAAIMECMDG